MDEKKIFEEMIEHFESLIPRTRRFWKRRRWTRTF